MSPARDLEAELKKLRIFMHIGVIFEKSNPPDFSDNDVG